MFWHADSGSDKPLNARTSFTISAVRRTERFVPAADAPHRDRTTASRGAGDEDAFRVGSERRRLVPIPSESGPTLAEDDVETCGHAEADAGLGPERQVLAAQHAPVTAVDVEEGRHILTRPRRYRPPRRDTRCKPHRFGNPTASTHNRRCSGRPLRHGRFMPPPASRTDQIGRRFAEPVRKPPRRGAYASAGRPKRYPCLHGKAQPKPETL